jgi:flavin reductase (DIM6/NTAB) family NADH-FMN oxidoreductase RutF
MGSLFDLVDRELWVVTAQAGASRGGLVATFVGQASIVPELPRVVVGLDRLHYTWDLVEAGRAFALHLIGEEHLDWVWRFGLTSGRTADKLAGLRLEAGPTGSPLLADALGWLDCRVEASLDTGDRTLYLAEVVEERVLRPVPPLTFRRLLQLAPPDRLAEMKRQYEADGAADAAAIRAWRGRAGPGERA